jgi:pimeloyl-ACP methyl ester carboxylesterase
MTVLRKVAAMAAVVLTATLGGFKAHAQTAAPVEARNVVLIHGAWADGSSWAEVIPLLQAAGLKVTAVQNPLTSLANSVAATRRALALQDGPTVLVAHSWGGTVLSETGIDPKVTALVYVAARAPDAGEDFLALSGKFPTGAVRAGVQEHDGFTKISEESFLKYFANGVEPKKAEVLYAVQEPTAASLLAGRTTAAAWRFKPSWYAVSKLDHRSHGGFSASGTWLCFCQPPSQHGRHEGHDVCAVAKHRSLPGDASEPCPAFISSRSADDRQA